MQEKAPDSEESLQLNWTHESSHFGSAQTEVNKKASTHHRNVIDATCLGRRDACEGGGREGGGGVDREGLWRGGASHRMIRSICFSTLEHE